MISGFIKRVGQVPRRIFLIDAAGALLTALLLFLVLRRYAVYIGMPRHTIEVLALIASAFALYSASSFLFFRKRWKPFLALIILANLFYCCLTVFLMFSHRAEITAAGLFYFSGEILVIMTLVILELKLLFAAKSA